jgi:hypothetical protein
MVTDGERSTPEGMRCFHSPMVVDAGSGVGSSIYLIAVAIWKHGFG